MSTILERLDLTPEDVARLVAQHSIKKDAVPPKTTTPIGDTSATPPKPSSAQERKAPSPKHRPLKAKPPEVAFAHSVVALPTGGPHVHLTIVGRGYIPIRRLGSSGESVYSLSAGKHLLGRATVGEGDDAVPWLVAHGLSIDGEWGLPISELSNMRRELPEGIKSITF
jgi:hypothetical protein